MGEIGSRGVLKVLASPSAMLLTALFASNLLANVAANYCFRVSATSSSWRNLVLWQVLGGVAGSVAVLALTAILRSVPLRVAFPVTVGLAVIGVQIVASRLLFHEAVTTVQGLGALLVIAGIVLVAGRW